MKKVIEFLKTNFELAKWTIEYFLFVWLVLHFIFQFDVFSARHWLKFFHSSFHGFEGFVFATFMYTSIPIYIATSLNVYKNKKSLITIPVIDKVLNFIQSKLSTQKSAEEPETQPVEEPETESVEDEFPSDMPPELRVPFMRAKQHMSLTGAVSVYNKFDNKPEQPQVTTTPAEEEFPIPTDFDIPSDTDFDFQSQEPSIPQFQDIVFDDIPDIVKPNDNKNDKKLENETTKYLDSKNIKYNTMDDFIITDGNVIYEHNDEDFWIMDEDTWFASGKQKDSPIPLLKAVAQDGYLTPVIYLKSKNIMNLDGVIEKFTSMGIKVIKSLEELD